MQGALPSIQGVNITNNGFRTFQFTPINPQNVIGYEWNFGDGSAISYAANPIHTYPDNGIYTAVVKLSSTCGYVIDTLPANIVGIDQVNIDNKDLKIFPNPSTDITTIQNNGNFKMKQVDMYNMVGQLIYSQSVDNSQRHTLSVSGFASGIYTIRIMTDKGSVTRKLEILR
jgi:hypothetical protein